MPSQDRDSGHDESLPAELPLVTEDSEAGVGPPPGRPWARFALVFAALMVVAALTGAGLAYFLNLDLPDVRALEDYRPATISRLLASDGTVIHQFATERRIVIPFEDIPSSLIDAVVATEDANFYSHVGVDPLGILRALVHDIRVMRIDQGGSTLTQQLALGLFLQRDKTLTRKIREAILATHIEKTYTKEEILTFYCNQVYMGHGYYGVEAASQFYFGKRAKSLTLPEAALLGGIIQIPENLSPHRNPERALRRRNHVLERMLEVGYITPQQHDEVKAQPIKVIEPRQPVLVADYFIEEIRREIDSRYGGDALYRSGLTIETGLDLALQTEAEAALQRGVREIAKRQGFEPPSLNILDGEEAGSLEEYAHPDWIRPLAPGMIVHGLVMEAAPLAAKIRLGGRTFEIGKEAVSWTGRLAVDKCLRKGDVAPFLVQQGAEAGELALELSAEPTADGAVVALDPATGEIRALVGGLDFGRSQFDRAIQAQRQPGSSFKPIVYAAALEEGWRPTDLLLDEPTVFRDPRSSTPYQPENYYRDYTGIVTVRRALELSLNIPTVRLLNMIGYRRVVDQAARMGIRSHLLPYPSLALGASEVTLLEMVSAYSTFANLGTRVEPRLFTRLAFNLDRRTEEEQPRASDALRPEVAYMMTSLLKGVVARGTGKAAASMGDALAGKTGTTDDNTDAWFIGYSPSIVVGVWVGRDEKQPIGRLETGPRAALPIWMDIMKSWLERHPDESFRRPPGIETVAVDPDTGRRAGVDTHCQRVILEEFRAADGPPPPCGAQAHRRAHLPYYLQRFPWLDATTMILTDGELARLLRESGHELLVDASQKLIVPSSRGVDVIPFTIVPPGHPLLAGLPGAAALAAAGLPAGAPGQRSRFGDSAGLDYPSDLAPIEYAQGEGAETGILGIDGRSAAIVRIHYP
jgi:penicillin-binding protein 1A